MSKSTAFSVQWDHSVGIKKNTGLSVKKVHPGLSFATNSSIRQCILLVEYFVTTVYFTIIKMEEKLPLSYYFLNSQMHHLHWTPWIILNQLANTCPVFLFFLTVLFWGWNRTVWSWICTQCSEKLFLVLVKNMFQTYLLRNVWLRAKILGRGTLTELLSLWAVFYTVSLSCKSYQFSQSYCSVSCCLNTHTHIALAVSALVQFHWLLANSDTVHFPWLTAVPGRWRGWIISLTWASSCWRWASLPVSADPLSAVPVH